MRRITVPLILASAALMGCGAQPAEEASMPQSNAKYYVYFGTGGGDAKGIYVSEYDPASGTATQPKLATEVEGAGFVEIHPSGDYLYATARSAEGEEPWQGVAAYTIDHATGMLSPLNRASGVGQGPAHVGVSHAGTTAAVANYGSGSVASFAIRPDGTLSEAVSFFQHTGSSIDPERQNEPHVHSVNFSPGDRFLLVADLGIDEIVIYAHDAATGTLTKHGVTKTPAGGGPRHLTFDPAGKFVYLINEMGGSITVFAWDAAGALTELQTISTLPADFTGANKTSEVLVHPSGKFVYGANRGHDSIAVFSVDPSSGKLTFVESVTEGVVWPRNFRIDPTGKYMLVGNRNSDDVGIFNIDPATGKLTPTGDTLAVPQPICIRFVKAQP